MKVAFVIISVSDRIKELNDLVRSILLHERFEGYELNLMFQDNLKVADQIENREAYKNIFVVPERLGCNGARIELLKRIYKDYDVFINLDDDMLMTEHTNYEPAIEKAMEKTTGFVLTNWARTQKIYEGKIAKIRNQFVPQVMVYQGGGMIYTRKIASAMTKLPVEKTTFDNSWCLTSYLLGYTNYRYLGSLTIHMICGKGGMRAFMSEEEHKLTQEEYINYRRSEKGRKGHEVCIPLDSDLKPICHEIHKINKQKLTGE